jgi:hypothetical protein
MTMDDLGEDFDDQEGRLAEVLETLTTEELLQLVAEIEERIGLRPIRSSEVPKVSDGHDGDRRFRARPGAKDLQVPAMRVRGKGHKKGAQGRR